MGTGNGEYCDIVLTHFVAGSTIQSFDHMGMKKCFLTLGVLCGQRSRATNEKVKNEYSSMEIKVMRGIKELLNKRR